MTDWLDIAENWAWTGAFVVVFFKFSVFKNKKEKGQSRKSWTKWLLDELNDWAVILIGTFIFYYLGDNIITGACRLIGKFSPVDYDTCISIYIDAQEFVYLTGGALFGLSLYGGFQLYMNYRAKKIKNNK